MLIILLYWAKTKAIDKYFIILVIFWLNLLVPKVGVAIEFYQQTSLSQMVQDQQGFIWSTSQFGLQRFDGYQTLVFNSQSQPYRLPFNWVNHIFQDGDSFILSTAKKGIWRFYPEKGEAKLIFKLSNDTVFQSILDKNNLYYATPSGVYHYHLTTKVNKKVWDDTGILRLILHDQYLFGLGREGIKQFNLTNQDIVHLINDRGHRFAKGAKTIVALTTKYLLQINLENLEITKKPNHINARHLEYTKTRQGFWVLGDSQEILLLDETRFDTKPHKLSQPKYQPFYLFEDSSGVVWTASNRGIEKLIESFIVTHPFISKLSNMESIAAFNKIWIGTPDHGIYQFIDNKYLPVEEINQHLKGKSRHIAKMFKLGQELLFITWEGIFGFNYYTKKLTRYLENLASQQFLNLEADENYLYLSSDGHGAYILKTDTKELVHHITHDLHGLSSDEVTDIAVDQESIWITTSEGIDRFNLITERLTPIYRISTSKFITVEIVNQKIYAGSFGDGLFIFNAQGTLINKLYTGSHISEMKLLDQTLWIGSRQGIYKLSPISDIPELLSGSRNISVSGGVFIFKNTGYVSGKQGLTQFILTPNQDYQPNLVVSQIKSQGELTMGKPQLKLNSSQNTIELQLASLDYRNPLIHRFKYRINDNDWVEAFGNSLNFTNLASGEYLIEFKGTNSVGKWSRKQGAIQINILPPWYWNTAAQFVYSLTGILLTFLLAWFIYLKILSTRQLHTMLRQEIVLKGSTVNSVQTSLHRIKELIEPGLSANQEITAICEQAIQLLQQNHTQKIPDHLEDKHLNDAIPYLLDYFSQTFHIKLHYLIDLKEYKLDKEIEKDIYKILYEIISHGVMNSEGTSFEVNVRIFHEKFWLIIHEDGQGFRKIKSKAKVNLGLYVLRKLLEKYYGRLEITPKKPSGTIVTLSIPLQKHFNRFEE